MAATGIRPQSARVIFVRAALLDHDAPARVDHEDRKRAMQEPGAMNRGFARRAAAAVAFAARDQLLLGGLARHAFFPPPNPSTPPPFPSPPAPPPTSLP